MVMVMANTAARARMAPAMEARIRVSRVDMNSLDSPASTIWVTNSLGTRYDMGRIPCKVSCWCCHWQGRESPPDRHSGGPARRGATARAVPGTARPADGSAACTGARQPPASHAGGRSCRALSRWRRTAGPGCGWRTTARPRACRAGRTAPPGHRRTRPLHRNGPPDPGDCTAVAIGCCVPAAVGCPGSRRGQSAIVLCSSECLLFDGDEFQVIAGCRPRLAALSDKADIGIGALVIDEGAEALELLRVLQGIGPFAFVAIDDLLHLFFQLRTQSQAVLEDHLLQIIQAAVQALAPGGGALQPVGCAD